MGEYKIFHSNTFDRKLGEFGADFHKWLDKIEDQLSENPYTGDPLGARWFREKKHNGFRVYYLVYENVKSVYMVGISGKKDQQKVINTIRLLLEFYRKEIEELVKTIT